MAEKGGKRVIFSIHFAGLLYVDTAGKLIHFKRVKCGHTSFSAFDGKDSRPHTHAQKNSHSSFKI